MNRRNPFFPAPRRARQIIALMAAAAGLWLSPAGAQARLCRVGLMPNGSKFSCGACHISQSGGDARNEFGKDVEELVGIGTCEQFWGAALAAIDSDCDGKTNGEELQDPNGTWRPGNSNPSPSLATNPGNGTCPIFTPSLTPTASDTPSPIPTDTPTPIPTASPTPCPGALAPLIRGYLLGETADPSGLDINQDGAVDIADLALANLPCP